LTLFFLFDKVKTLAKGVVGNSIPKKFGFFVRPDTAAARDKGVLSGCLQLISWFVLAGGR
jgi:hypothetical protein